MQVLVNSELFEISNYALIVSAALSLRRTFNSNSFVLLLIIILLPTNFIELTRQYYDGGLNSEQATWFTLSLWGMAVSTLLWCLSLYPFCKVYEGWIKQKNHYRLKQLAHSCIDQQVKIEQQSGQYDVQSGLFALARLQEQLDASDIDDSVSCQHYVQQLVLIMNTFKADYQSPIDEQYNGSKGTLGSAINQFEQEASDYCKAWHRWSSV